MSASISTPTFVVGCVMIVGSMAYSNHVTKERLDALEERIGEAKAQARQAAWDASRATVNDGTTVRLSMCEPEPAPHDQLAQRCVVWKR